VAELARLIFGLTIGFGITGLWQMHSTTIKSLGNATPVQTDAPGNGIPRKMESKLQKLETEMETMMAYGKKQTIESSKLKKIVQDDHKTLLQTQNDLQELLDLSKTIFSSQDAVMKDIAALKEAQTALKKETQTSGGTSPKKRTLKVHLWDDTTHKAPREDILEAEGWTEYNGLKLGDPTDSSTPPVFVRTDDPGEADLIIWVTVMAVHEAEVPPKDPIQHAHKVIVLDYSDGCTIHKTLDTIRKTGTEIAYFKRSYVRRADNNRYDGNCTGADREVFPYAYSGTKAMMIPSGTPEAKIGFEVVRGDDALLYGKIPASPPSEKENNGYFQTERYDNYLVPFRDRKWTVTNIIRYREDGRNLARNNAVLWTREFAQQQAGEPKKHEEIKDNPQEISGGEAGDFTAYVGEIDNFCQGYCFGANYLRHLRDAKIIVTCNPADWEGDFRLYESFLSGALVMVDKMAVLDFMPNPPIDGTHWVVYDPSDKDDFMKKIAYYSDPANLSEAEKIAHNGYEHVLRYHMTVNRVNYLLHHPHVRNELAEFVEDPSMRLTLGLPPK